MVQVFNKLALNMRTWKFADVWLCSMDDSVIYGYKNLLKKIDLIDFFFFQVSKINLFWYTWIISHCEDIFCYSTGFILFYFL